VGTRASPPLWSAAWLSSRPSVLCPTWRSVQDRCGRGTAERSLSYHMATVGLASIEGEQGVGRVALSGWVAGRIWR
jgi:hypothetical protein